MPIVIVLPKVLQDKLGPEGAEALIDILNKTEEQAQKDIIKLVEERFEKRLAQVETRLIRWMFIFWVGQIGVITGILFAFFK